MAFLASRLTHSSKIRVFRRLANPPDRQPLLDEDVPMNFAALGNVKKILASR
jgi:hypothetical protein